MTPTSLQAEGQPSRRRERRQGGAPIDPLGPKGRRKHWILYDGRASGGPGSDSDAAVVLVSCDSDKEARSYAGDYGDMACYTYDEQTQEELWLWDWKEPHGFSDGRNS